MTTHEPTSNLFSDETGTKTNLKIKENYSGDVFVGDLTEEYVRSPEQVMGLLNQVRAPFTLFHATCSAQLFAACYAYIVCYRRLLIVFDKICSSSTILKLVSSSSQCIAKRKKVSLWRT